MKAWSLEALVDPISKEKFFSGYFESQRLLVRRNRPDYFGELLTLDDVDRVLTKLRAGDTLYIPRGLVHEAISTEEPSLHITVGMLSWTWFDVLLEAVEKLASADRQVRSTLPPAFARADCDRDAFRKTFAEIAADSPQTSMRKKFAGCSPSASSTGGPRSCGTSCERSRASATSASTASSGRGRFFLI